MIPVSPFASRADRVRVMFVMLAIVTCRIAACQTMSRGVSDNAQNMMDLRY